MMKRIKSQRGTALVLVAAAMSVLLGVMGLAVDYGMGVATRSRLQSAADAASLAGAAELPESFQNAADAAFDYCARHGISSSEVAVSFPSSPTRITVRITHPVKYLFARILGQTDGTVAAEATAENGAISALGGVIPIGVEQTEFEYGVMYRLKRGAGSCDHEGVSGSCSNFGPLALGGYGANVYEDNIIEGYDGVLRVGQWVTTETGDMVGPTRRGIDNRLDSGPGETYFDFPSGSRRLVYVPILETLDVGGRDEVKIVGFAAFFLEDTGGQGEVFGRFIKYGASGDIDPNADVDFQLHGVRLIR